MARPTKYTAELGKNIAELISKGCTYKSAAESLGVDYSTFRRWIVRGESEEEGEFCEFCETIKKAQAIAIADCELKLRKLADKGNVAAIIFYLTNRDPENWKDKRAITGKIEQVHKYELMTDAELETSLEADFQAFLEEYEASKTQK